MQENKVTKGKHDSQRGNIFLRASIPSSTCTVTTAITCLSIVVCNESAKCLVNLLAESLVYLKLKEPPETCSSLQKYFCKDSDASMTTFCRLTEMKLEFYGNKDRANGRFYLKCPNLQVFGISNSSYSGLRNLLDHKETSWSSVHTLKIGLDRSPEFRQMESTIEWEMAEMLANSMPNVEYLKLKASFANDKNIGVFDRLVNSRYLKRIKRLECNVPIVFTRDARADRLEHLDAVMDESSKAVLPRVNARNMVHLGLKNLSRFSWDCFENTETPGLIDFEKLKTLRLEFSNKLCKASFKNSCSESRYQVNMGGIESMSLAAPQAFGNAAIADVHCSGNGKLRVSGPLQLLSVLERTRTNSAHSIDIVISKVYRDEERQFYKRTNHIFSNIVASSRAKLSLCKLPFAIRPGETEWAFLHELRLEVGPEFEVLADLIWHLVNLEKLVVGTYQIANGGARLDDLTNQRSQKTRVLSLSTTLTTLKILQLAAPCSSALAIKSFSYLLVALPSLSNACVPCAPKDKCELVDQYKDMYPHVSSTKIQYLGTDQPAHE